MLSKNTPLLLAGLPFLVTRGGPRDQEKPEAAANTPAQTVAPPAADSVHLPALYATKSVTNRVSVQPWPVGKTPVAPAGFTVAEYAGTLDSPRWLYVLPNGDVLVADDAADKIWRVSAAK